MLCAQVQFLDGRDPDDPVVKSHYRNIRTFTADDPQPLVTGQSAACCHEVVLCNAMVCVVWCVWGAEDAGWHTGW